MPKKAIKGSKRKAKNPPEKEEIVEYFDVVEGGKEKEVKVEKTGTIPDNPSENQIKEENKTLKIVLMIIGGIFVILIAMQFVANAVKTFEHNGIDYEITKEGNLVFYKTSFPVIYQGKELPYNFYLRNDPRKLEEVAFNGEINFKKDAVINATNELNCDGDGIIAVANLANLKIFDMKIIKDQNATCSQNGNYMFINLERGNESKIEQFGPACYQLTVNSCEILKVTEKFMIEYFSKINDAVGKN